MKLRVDVASEIGIRERGARRAEPVEAQVEGRAEEQDVGVGAKVAVQAVEGLPSSRSESRSALGQRCAAIQPMREAHRLLGAPCSGGPEHQSVLMS